MTVKRRNPRRACTTKEIVSKVPTTKKRKKPSSERYFQREGLGTLKPSEIRYVAEQGKISPLLYRVLRELELDGPLDSSYLSPASFHRLRRVNRYFKAVAEQQLRKLPDLVVLGGANFALGGGGVSVRRTGEAFNFLEMKWSEVPGPPIARSAAACCEIQGKIFIAGGAYRNDCGMLLCECCEEATSDCYLFDPKTMAWTTLPPMPSPLIAPRAVAVEDGILLIGGARPPRLDDPSENVVRVLREDIVDLDDDLAGLADDDGRIAVPVQPSNIWGDVDLKFWRGTSNCYKLRLDDDKKEWICVGQLPDSTRGGGVCRLGDGRVLVTGEYWSTSFTLSGTLSGKTFISDENNFNRWVPGRSMDDLTFRPPSKRFTRRRLRERSEEIERHRKIRGASAAVSLGGSRVLVLGGKIGTESHDRLRLYDARSETWTLLNPKLPVAVDGVGATRIGCSVVFAGGAWREFHPSRPNTHRDNASNSAALFDIDTGRVLPLPSMFMDRADPAVASSQLLLNNPAYDAWRSASLGFDADHGLTPTLDFFLAPPSLAGCTIS